MLFIYLIKKKKKISLIVILTTPKQTIEDGDTQVDFSGISVNKSDVTSIQADGRCQRLSQMHFNWCGLDDAFCHKLCEWLSPPCRITTINLVGNNITDKGAGYLAEALEKDGNQIAYLSVSVNKITNSGLFRLLEAATSPQSKLSDLRIGNNKICFESAAELDKFYGCGCLVFVDFRDNKINQKVVTEIMKGFATGSRLTTIDIKGIIPQARAPVKRHKLTDITTGGDEISIVIDDGMIEIDAGDSNQKLQTITPIAASPADELQTHDTSQNIIHSEEEVGTVEYSLNPDHSYLMEDETKRTDSNNSLDKPKPDGNDCTTRTNVSGQDLQVVTSNLKTTDITEADVPEWSNPNFNSSLKQTTFGEGDMQPEDSIQTTDEPDWSPDINEVAFTPVWPENNENPPLEEQNNPHSNHTNEESLVPDNGFTPQWEDSSNNIIKETAQPIQSDNPLRSPEVVNELPQETSSFNKVSDHHTNSEWIDSKIQPADTDVGLEWSDVKQNTTAVENWTDSSQLTEAADVTKQLTADSQSAQVTQVQEWSDQPSQPLEHHVDPNDAVDVENWEDSSKLTGIAVNSQEANVTQPDEVPEWKEIEQQRSSGDLNIGNQLTESNDVTN